MSATRINVTDTDTLVETMTNLVNQGVSNLVEFARLLPALWDAQPWSESDNTDITVYMTETFGIGSSRDGYVTLPQIALDTAIAAFVAEGTKLTYAQITALTGASRATAARAAAKGGMSDSVPTRNPNKGNSDKSDNSGTPGTSTHATETPEFDLSALLSALDDSELKSVLSAVGLDRVRKVIA